MIWPNFRPISSKDGIFRSCSPDLLDYQTVRHYLDKYEINGIVDLRTSRELGENTKILRDKVQLYLNISLQEDSEQFKSIAIPTEADYIDYYLRIIDSCTQEIKEIMHVLSNKPSTDNLLIFCHAGKDRTGLIAWMFQEYKGFDIDDIYSGYCATKDNLVPFIDIFKAHWTKRGLSKEDYLIRFNANPMILRVVRDNFISQYGSIQKFMGE